MKKALSSYGSFLKPTFLHHFSKICNLPAFRLPFYQACRTIMMLKGFQAGSFR